jgi:large subunit ribosomal protein L18
MSNKLTMRLRRKKKLRSKVKNLSVYRLSVHRTPKHIYAQIFADDGAKVVVSASSLDKVAALAYGGNCAAATKIGELVAKRAKEAGIEKVVFDRSWFKYHGRVKSLAEAARENGLIF